MRRYIVILGMPGAGKDTQCDMLADKIGAHVVKTGNMARQAAKHDDRLEDILERGGLVDDELINQLVDKELASLGADTRVVFDGFPRHVGQAKWLDGLVGSSEPTNPRPQAFYLEISHDTAKKRLMSRHREDDTEEIIDQRLVVFERETKPVVEFYKASGRLTVIDGAPSSETVFASLLAEVEKAL